MDFESELTPPIETEEQLEQRQEKEREEFYIQCKNRLKGTKKNAKKQLEIECVQLEYELKRKHKDEELLLEQQIEKFGEYVPPAGGVNIIAEKLESCVLDASNPNITTAEDKVMSKKEKAQRKKEKKQSKKNELLQEKHEIAAANADVVSNRDIEMEKIKNSLIKEDLAVYEVEADGHCLYRALAHQLNLNAEETKKVWSVADLRGLAAEEIQSHKDTYAPFICIFGEDAESDAQFDEYVARIRTVHAAEWGGQIEIKALVCALHRDVWIYSADIANPIIKMNVSNDGMHNQLNVPLRVSYHKQYYALGEHYNSVIPIGSEHCSTKQK